ncbi:hypothetical protein CAPTEDRAFT_171065, partial [Capitella teleta]
MTHNIDWLKTQCDLAMKELQTMKRQLGDTVKKCDHAMKEADMHRHNYYKARDKVDQLKGDNASLKAHLTQVLDDKQTMAREVSELQKVHEEDVQEMTQLRKQQRDVLCQGGPFEGFSIMYDAAVARYESLQRECDSLRKQISENAAQHHSVREEREQEEDKEALRKHAHALSQENADLKKETQSLQKKCRELEHRMSQAVSDKLRTSKDIARIRGERDAVVHEYTLVMSERDTVHKEIEQLQDTLNSVREKQQKAEKDKEAAQDQLQTLQQQMNATRQQHNCTLKELDSIKRTSSPFLVAQDDHTNALKEVDDIKRGRDWAFSERDKIVRERESMRALCDKLRHERDSNVNKLIEALRDLDEVKKQKQEGQRDLKEVKDKYDALIEKTSRKRQLNCLSANHSRDSAIDADLQEWEIETLVLSLVGIDPDDLGFDLVGGRGDPQLPSDSDVFIGAVRQGSCAYGKLRTNDQVIRVNALEVITGVDKRAAYQAVRTGAVSKETVSVVVRRKKLATSRAVIPVHINLSADRDLGLNLENGLYVSRILPSSAAAKEGSLAIGDRIMAVNGNSIEPLSAAEVMRMAQESGQHVTFNVLRSYVQPMTGPCVAPPGHMTNSLPPVAPISMHSPNYSCPPSTDYPSTSSTGLSLRLLLPQSSSTPLDHSTQSGSEDFPYTTFHPRTQRNRNRCLSIAESPQSLDGCSTFPHRANRRMLIGQERIRIPSTPSVISSRSSVDGVSERGSPISPYMQQSCPLDYHGNQVGTSHSLPKAASSQRKYEHPSLGETRNIKVEKSIEPLGIQIESGLRGGIFVSSVSEHSLASRNGISVGDQLLEVCGINIRNATRPQAASVLRQMGGSINMLVQYNPDKFQDSSSSDSSDVPHRVSNETLTPDTISHSSKGASVTACVIPEEPLAHQQRYVVLKKPNGPHDSIGVSIVGGNAVGIFVHQVQPNSSAAKGLRCGDEILEWNGVPFRLLTAEQAMNEIAKPAESVSVLAHYNYTKYSKMIDQSGDAFYVRAMFERRSEGEGELSFNRDSVLFVNCTMPHDRVGEWRAWLMDEEGNKVCCGCIPSKARLEDELFLKRSLSEHGDEDLKSSRRSSGSARRSFFRKRKHHRSNSRDSRDLASFSDASINSDCVPFLEDGSVLTFERVERVDC